MTTRPPAQRKRTSAGSESAAETRRAEIVAAATYLFGAKGFHATSMDDIARIVGVAKPTIYYYVRSKEEILYWIQSNFMDSVIESLERRLVGNPSPTKCVAGIVEDLLQGIESNGNEVRVFFENRREVRAKSRGSIEKKLTVYEGLVESVLIAGVAVGEFEIEDISTAKLALFGMCNWAYQWYRKDGKYAIPDLARQFSNIFVKGISAPNS